MSRNNLFSDCHLSDVLRSNLDKAREAVEQLPEEQFAHNADEVIVEHVYSRMEVVPLALLDEQKEMDSEEIKIDVCNDGMRLIPDPSRSCLIPGIRITVTVPFEGDAGLWRCQPSNFTFNPPDASITPGQDNMGGTLIIVAESPSDTAGDGTKIRQEIETTLGNIRVYIENARKDVNLHNQQLRQHIQQCIGNRRTRLGIHSDIAKTLNIPLRKKPGSPDIAALPMKRKLVKPLPTTPPTLPEPGIRDEDYTHILNVIRQEGRTFETTPKTFAKHDEQELRDIILAHLNGHYEGDATGETFRGLGKTDIRIELNGRAAFIAECKIWHGQKQLVEALDQLLGYLTWRDSKAALVIFNVNVAGFTSLQKSVPETLKAQQNYTKELSCAESGEWRFAFRTKHDLERLIAVHVFLFNLYMPHKVKKV